MEAISFSLATVGVTEAAHMSPGGAAASLGYMAKKLPWWVMFFSRSKGWVWVGAIIRLKNKRLAVNLLQSAAIGSGKKEHRESQLVPVACFLSHKRKAMAVRFADTIAAVSLWRCCELNSLVLNSLVVGCKIKSHGPEG